MISVIMAWRNIWRNKGRSIALLLAILTGVTSGLLLMALSFGLIQQRFINLIERQYSHVQIHHSNYLNEQEPGLSIENIQPLRGMLDTLPTVKAYSGRVLVQAMLSSSYGSTGLEVLGINPVEEILPLEKQIISGDYLPDQISNGILISAATAEKLRISEGERLVLTFQDTQSEIVSAAFRVTGIFRSSNTSFDEGRVYVKAKDLQILLNPAQPIWHELAIMAFDYNQAFELSHILQNHFPNLDIRDWKTLSPEASLLVEQGNFMSYIFLIIILLGLAFGILNTMLMAVFERMKELGMLLAIGMGKKWIAIMIVLETVYISLVGGLLGVLIGLGIIKLLHQKGLNLSGFSDALAEYGYDSVIFPAIPANSVILIVLLVFGIALGSSITPALKAIRLKPAEAVRKN